jgi:hypothetical protein
MRSAGLLRKGLRGPMRALVVEGSIVTLLSAPIAPRYFTFARDLRQPGPLPAVARPPSARLLAGGHALRAAPRPRRRCRRSCAGSAAERLAGSGGAGIHRPQQEPVLGWVAGEPDPGGTEGFDQHREQSVRPSPDRPLLTTPREHTGHTRLLSRSGARRAKPATRSRPAPSTGTASGKPEFPNATHTLRAKPERLARPIGEPRENDSHAASSSAVSSSAMSDGDAVPGCERNAPRSSCTPNGGSPGARAANAGSDVACENRRVKGQTSWELCRLTGYEIPLSCGLFRRSQR